MLEASTGEAVTCGEMQESSSFNVAGTYQKTRVSAGSGQAVYTRFITQDPTLVFITSYCTCASFYSSLRFPASMHVLCQRVLINLAAMVVSPPRICKTVHCPSQPGTPCVQMKSRTYTRRCLTDVNLERYIGKGSRYGQRDVKPSKRSP